jgi:hypothetical protein
LKTFKYNGVNIKNSLIKCSDKKMLELLVLGVIMYMNRWKAWVMPESKYSISGIKNGIPFFFHYRSKFLCHIWICPSVLKTRLH